MKILIVEDEPDLASFMKKGLEENGHEAMVAYDGEMGLKLASTVDFDCILLDVIIPKINGLDVCDKLRKSLEYTNPIIIMTALGATDDVVDGLNRGADDYLVKPVKFRELLARLQAHSRRRTYHDNSETYTLGDLTLDMKSKEVSRNGKSIKLTAKEFNLLAYLLRNQGRVVSRMDILENVWDINFDMGTNVTDVYINYLRKKVDKGREDKMIHTVVGMGYVMKLE